MIPTSPNSCELRYVVNTDLGGSIPNMIIQQVAMDQPMIAAAVRDYAANLKDGKYDYETVHKRWEAYIRKKGTGNEKTVVVEEKTGQEIFKDDEISAPLLRNALFMEYEVHAKDAIDTVLRAIDSNSKWTQIPWRNNLDLTVRQFEGRNVFRGRIMSSASPQQLLSLITPRSRLIWYDENLSRVEQFETVNESTNVRHF